MKLSANTLTVLKNFSKINNTILIRKGASLITVDMQKQIVADAKLQDSFPQDFAIYNLAEFLGVNSVHENSELDFQSEKVVFLGQTGKDRLEYFYSDASVVQDALPTWKKIPSVFDEASIVHRFTLSHDGLSALERHASLLSLTHLSFVGEDGVVQVVVHDKESRSTQNKFTLNVDGFSSRSETYSMRFQNLRVLPDSYDVEVSPTIAHFVGKTNGVQYWIVMEAN